jgi:hypothetical protein
MRSVLKKPCQPTPSAIFAGVLHHRVALFTSRLSEPLRAREISRPGSEEGSAQIVYAVVDQGEVRPFSSTRAMAIRRRPRGYLARGRPSHRRAMVNVHTETALNSR